MVKKLLISLLVASLVIVFFAPAVSAKSPDDIGIRPTKASGPVKLWTGSTTLGGIDLTIADTDIAFQPTQPAAGETVTIDATVHNNGTEKVRGILMRFLADTAVIGDKTIHGVIQPGASKVASVEWVPEAEGTYTITVQVDPEDAIAESNDANNEASTSITVGPPGALPPPPPPTPADKWAVLIGIADYEGTANDIWHPDDDAMEMYEALTTNYGFAESNIKMLIDSEATLDNIQAAIAWIKSNAGPNSTVVFFYSGHGYQALETEWANTDGYDEPVDGADEFIVSYDLWAYADGYLRSDFEGFNPSKFMLWFGMCYAGGMDDLAADGRVIPTACKEGQSSYDTRANNANPPWAPPWAGNTLFGYYYVDEGMLQALGEGTLTEDGEVTVEEAFWYAKPLVEAWAESEGKVSQPLISDNYVGELHLR